MHRLYAYVADNDLGEIEALVAGEFERFTASWNVTGVRLRNAKAPPAFTPEGELPDWNLGLSVEAGSLTPQQLQQLVSFLAVTSGRCGKNFAVGTWSPQTSTTEDLCFVDSAAGAEVAPTLLERLDSHPWSVLRPR